MMLRKQPLFRWVCALLMWPCLSLANTTHQPIPLTEIKTFAEVFEELKTNYVHEMEDKAVIESAIDGMLERLDPHSTYLTPEALATLNSSTEGKFGGLGIEVKLRQGILRIISPIDGSPAHRAGIKPGDEVTYIDGKAVKIMTMREIIQAIRGPIGSKVDLEISRPGRTDPIKVTLTREVVKTKSVTVKQFGSTGYVRISQFQRNTHELLIKAIRTLKKQKAKTLLIDLRNNPGGLLKSAVAVTDAFVTKGIIVSTKGRTERETQSFRATSTDLTKGMPIYVLINAGSASASEIVAGALQDHQRATILGTKSFGKGSVQTVIPLQNKGALKLTTALYYTPNGHSIQASGILPDILVEPIRIEGLDQDGRGYREADLPGHIENPTAAKSDSEDGYALALQDYQLYQSLNIIQPTK